MPQNDVFESSDWLLAKRFSATVAVPGTDPGGAIAKFTSVLDASVESKRCIFFCHADFLRLSACVFCQMRIMLLFLYSFLCSVVVVVVVGLVLAFFSPRCGCSCGF